jgi:hypothetical protein
MMFTLLVVARPENNPYAQEQEHGGWWCTYMMKY